MAGSELQINGAMKLELEFSQFKDKNRSLLAEKVVDQKVVIEFTADHQE